MGEEKTLRERIEELEKWQEQANAQLNTYRTTMITLNQRVSYLENDVIGQLTEELRTLGQALGDLSRRVSILENGQVFPAN